MAGRPSIVDTSTRSSHSRRRAHATRTTMHAIILLSTNVCLMTGRPFSIRYDDNAHNTHTHRQLVCDCVAAKEAKLAFLLRIQCSLLLFDYFMSFVDDFVFLCFFSMSFWRYRHFVCWTQMVRPVWNVWSDGRGKIAISADLLGILIPYDDMEQHRLFSRLHTSTMWGGRQKEHDDVYHVHVHP